MPHPIIASVRIGPRLTKGLIILGCGPPIIASVRTGKRWWLQAMEQQLPRNRASPRPLCNRGCKT